MKPVDVLAGPAASAASFEYHRPEQASEVDELLALHREEARLLAGGTDLIAQMRSGRRRPEHVIDLVDVSGIDEIALSGSRLKVGAMAPLWDLGRGPEVTERFPPLTEGARVVGSPQIQAKATLAGNTCNASPAADTAPALFLYDAVVAVRSVRGRRDVPIADFWLGPGHVDLAADEWVESITLNDPGPHGAAYVKLGRTRGVDLAVVGVACLVQGRSVRAAAVSIGPTPRRLPNVESLLLEEGTTDDMLVEAVASDTDPISDLRAGRDYRLAMTAVCAKRATTIASTRMRRNAT